MVSVDFAYRYTVKDLLQHDFFMEDIGIKVELVRKDDLKESRHGVIQLQMQMVNPKKRKQQHGDNEAIQFDYNIDKDDPQQVALEMVRSGYAYEEDAKTIARLIHDQIKKVTRQQEAKCSAEVPDILTQPSLAEPPSVILSSAAAAAAAVETALPKAADSAHFKEPLLQASSFVAAGISGVALASAVTRGLVSEDVETCHSTGN